MLPSTTSAIPIDSRGVRPNSVTRHWRSARLIRCRTPAATGALAPRSRTANSSPPVARHKIAAAHAALQEIRCAADQRVARGMPVLVVGPFQVVQVADDDEAALASVTGDPASASWSQARRLATPVRGSVPLTRASRSRSLASCSRATACAISKFGRLGDGTTDALAERRKSSGATLRVTERQDALDRWCAKWQRHAR